VRRLARFLALPSTEQRLVLAAAGLLAGVRVGLWVLPFRRVHGAVGALANDPRLRTGQPSVERIVWAVGAADCLVPRTNCLVRALAAHALLGRHGHVSRLKLGVAGGGGRDFEAHAWLEHDGRVVIGGPVDARYVSLSALGAPR